MAQQKQEFRLRLNHLKDVQDQNRRLIRNLRTGGALGRFARAVLLKEQGYMLSIVHVDTGWLKRSLRIQMNSATRGRIYIDGRTRNPRGGRPSVYGPWENARGGDHAFFDRTIAREPKFIAEAGRQFLRDLEK